MVSTVVVPDLSPVIGGIVSSSPRKVCKGLVVLISMINSLYASEGPKKLAYHLPTLIIPMLKYLPSYLAPIHAVTLASRHAVSSGPRAIIISLSIFVVHVGKRAC